MLIFLIFGCTEIDQEYDTDGLFDTIPTEEDFENVLKNTQDQLTQNFSCQAQSGVYQFITSSGIKVEIDTHSFVDENGESIEGNVSIEWLDFQDLGTMLSLNLSTVYSNQNIKDVFSSEQMIYIQAYQNGNPVFLNSSAISIQMPFAPDADLDYLLWHKDNESGEWYRLQFMEGLENGIQFSDNILQTTFRKMGWISIANNSISGEQAEIFVNPPDHYDSENSSVFIINKNWNENAIIELENYNQELQLFSDNFNHLPLGTNCHIIFISVKDQQYYVDVQTLSLQDDSIITFELGELVLMNGVQLNALIDSLL